MNEDKHIFDEEYYSGSEQTEGNVHPDESSKIENDKLIFDEEYSAINLEDAEESLKKYGIAKPKRVTVRGDFKREDLQKNS